MSHRPLKDALYTEFARVGQALAAPKRLEILDLLAQGPKSVEDLADQAAASVKNTSAHLRALRAAHLVDRERDGNFIFYRLASPRVGSVVRALQRLAAERLAEVERVADAFLRHRDELESIRLPELRRRLRRGDVLLLDVRPADEFAAGHIPGAVSIPVSELRRRIAEVPTAKEVVAYCRGEYCVYSLEAVKLLRKHGIMARRASHGLTEWRDAGFRVAKRAAGRGVD